MSPLETHTKLAQSSLARYCRTGVYQPIQGVNEKHVKQYRRLVFNIVEDSLSAAYPLTRNLLGQERWTDLVNEFFTEHPCQSPQVWTMPRELYQYMVEGEHALTKEYPFLQELLWMEWIEIELYMMEDIKSDSILMGASDDNLFLNPEGSLLHFHYPVHLKMATNIKAPDKGDYYLSMHRDPENGKIIFTSISIFFFRMLEKLSGNAIPPEDLVREVADEFDIPSDLNVWKKSVRFLESALESKLIFRKETITDQQVPGIL